MTTLSTLEKCVRILTLFREVNPALTVSDVAARLGLPKSTAYRYIASLKQHQFIEEDENTGNYRLGQMVLELARSISRKGPQEIALPFMERLSRQTGESIILAGLRKHEGICLEKVEGHHALRVTHEQGAVFPLHAGATGKVLMAHLSREEQDEIIEHRGLPRFSETTITDPVLLRIELGRIKKKGFAVSDGETIPNTYGIAAPIFTRSGKIVAALGVSVPSHRLEGAKRRAMIKLITTAAREITDKFSIYDIS